MPPLEQDISGHLAFPRGSKAASSPREDCSQFSSFRELKQGFLTLAWKLVKHCWKCVKSQHVLITALSCYCPPLGKINHHPSCQVQKQQLAKILLGQFF
jgi:hypothetical protein